MAFITITKPAQGGATKKSLLDAIIDNLTFLFGRQTSNISLSNGSFENDADADGFPDNWTFTQYPGGSFLRDNSTQQHGVYSAKFTSPGGASNGGGYLHSDDFIPVSPNRTVEVLWEMKSSVAGVSNRVEIFWYKSDQTASTTTSTSLYNSTANPTAWTAKSGMASPPADARFARIRITGCHTASTTAGSTWFDNVQVNSLGSQRIFTFDVSGTWVCPIWVSRVQVECWGGGGQGASSDVSGRAGGSGSYANGNYNVTPGASYTVTVGAGGTGGGLDGGDGGDSSFDSLITAHGGQGGTNTGGRGAGGVIGTGSDFSIVGANAVAFAGGSAPRGGAGGADGFAGSAPGGGGGCGLSNGAAGRVTIFALL